MSQQMMEIARPPTSRPTPLIVLAAVLVLQCSWKVHGFSSPDILTVKNAKVGLSSLAASREVLPNNALSTNTTISSLPLFHDDDPQVALSARLQTTVQPLVALIFFSFCVAVGVVAWEDYGATNLWPSRRMIVESTRLQSAPDSVGPVSSLLSSSSAVSQPFGARTVYGLAYGKAQRLQTLQNQQQQTPTIDTDSLLPEIKSYNEIGQEHREERVARWNILADTSTTKFNEQRMEGAVRDLQQVLSDIRTLQALAADYQWDDMHWTIQSSIVPKLEPAATVLRLHLMKDDINVENKMIGYEEVGFDWGSCAWRHCGALADAQEALDEMDHLLGVLEPPECFFCLNVAERSLRDILAAFPTEYDALKGIPAYIPYQSVHYTGNDDVGDETDLLDQDYLRMLKELRNSNADATNDDDD